MSVDSSFMEMSIFELKILNVTTAQTNNNWRPVKAWRYLNCRLTLFVSFPGVNPSSSHQFDNIDDKLVMIACKT